MAITAKKVVKTASEIPTSASSLAVKGGVAAARWALDKYRAYSKAKSEAEAKKRKDAAEKAADTYEVQPEGTKTMPKKKPPKGQLDRIEENQRRKRESLNY
jgi:hypothetical protein